MTACGKSKEYQKLLEPTRTRGLGLSICYQNVVEQAQAKAPGLDVRGLFRA